MAKDFDPHEAGADVRLSEEQFPAIPAIADSQHLPMSTVGLGMAPGPTRHGTPTSSC
jgi:hypothetical protein